MRSCRIYIINCRTFLKGPVSAPKKKPSLRSQQMAQATAAKPTWGAKQRPLKSLCALHVGRSNSRVVWGLLPEICEFRNMPKSSSDPARQHGPCILVSDGGQACAKECQDRTSNRPNTSPPKKTCKFVARKHPIYEGSSLNVWGSVANLQERYGDGW